MSSQINLMSKARSQKTFDPSKLAEVIYGSKATVDSRNEAYLRVERVLDINDTFKLPRIYTAHTRQEQILEGLRLGKATLEDDAKHGGTVFDYISYNGILANTNPVGFTKWLFAPFVKQQGTQEQIDHWIPLCESGKIIGAYTQTEMAHGSHVGGIETTATFDQTTDEFVVNSPTLSSIKYWPGTIAFTATHTVLMARLVINDVDHGVHAFIIQLRSLEDHKLLTGIELGDIGMKMAYNTTDNGYAIFSQVRIHRSQLLGRYTTVSRTGEYTTVPLRSKLVYGSMLNGRTMIIRTAICGLAQALTIAVRYSVVREQGAKLATGDDAETAIMTYKHQHYRLLTLIAQSYVGILVHRSSMDRFKDMKSRQDKGDHSTLAYTHMLMCGLKAWATQTAADGAEDARKMCGGHGYMLISGMPEIVNSTLATCTFEGENWVMWAQVARYMMKGLDKTRLPNDLDYMVVFDLQDRRCDAYGTSFLKSEVLIAIFEHRARRLAQGAYELVMAEEAKGKSRDMAENLNSVALMVASRAHIELFIITSAFAQVATLPSDTPVDIRTVLTRLATLYALTTIASPLSPFGASFIEDGYLSAIQVANMRILIDELLKKLLPDAIALTDAWQFSDGMLCSALGYKDGDVYRRIMEWTKQLPINLEAAKSDGALKKGWDHYMSPLLHREMNIKAKL